LKYFHREITVTATSQRSPFNNKYNVMITTSGVNNIGNSYFALKAKGESGRLDIWTNAPGAEFSSRGFDGWLEGDTEMTLNETGGTGKRITSVGAYTSDTTKHCINNRTYEVGYELNAVSPFSSRGFTADGRTKPDIIAPGSLITSAFNDVLAGDPLSYYYDTIEGIYIVHNDSCYYGVNSGTSMATPIVTGTYAIWLQAKPDLTPEEAKKEFGHTPLARKFQK
jgi:subtilisin family serine protease